HEVGSLAFEFRSKGAALFGHLTPRSGEHSRLNGCPVSLDHYTIGLVKNGSVLCIGVACKQQKPLKWLNTSGAFSFLPFEYDQCRGVQS
ncbi:hypothetical protein, partial [Pseudomonas poae]|uniref:hypothetical protein n=1 Tax=Pseudomonas poae TaxID=200451 RepID=UPI001B80462F